MRPLIAYSTVDLAGLGASRYLVDLLRARRCSVGGVSECFESDLAVVAGFNVDVVDLDLYSWFLDGFNSIIVLSRHRAESGRKTLSVHHPGNPTREAHGGEPLKLAIAYPALAWELLRAYARISSELGLEGYEVTLEATHHGPTGLRAPVVFIEIGSTEVEWRDEKARAAMAHAVAESLSRKPGDCKAVSAIGGPHYPSRYTKASLEGDMCFGHIIARHSIRSEDIEVVVRQAIIRNHPTPVATLVVERKSLNREQRDIIGRVAGELGVVVNYI
jgi:D-aminoacyl-tRNA deacylase